MIKLLLPLRDIYITQPFGVNFLDFYKKLGMAGHNGIDFRARTGCPVIAAHSGIIAFAGMDAGGGISVEIITSTEGEGYKTIYYHLKKINVAKGEGVKAGALIGWADNTGQYTTGDHLHFGLKQIYNGETINRDNGYFGAIDPTPYFPNNWDKSNAYHRYGRKQDWTGEWKMRFKNAWLHRQLIRRGLSPILGIEPINALVYGGWDFETAINPAMYEIWGWLKKGEYLEGKKPFI